MKTIKKIAALILACILLLLAGCSSAATDGTEPIGTEAVETDVAETAAPSRLSDEMVDYLQGRFDERVAQGGFKGAVLVMIDGEPFYEKGVGPADKDAGIENGPSVVYHLASITKQFTAAAIMMLYEEHKLDLNDTIDKYFPEYAHGSEVTIHQMLCMRSGIPDYVNRYDESGALAGSNSDEFIGSGISPDNTSEQNRRIIREWIFSKDLIFTPGEENYYCNSNYLLLGEIIEQVSGQRYADFIRERIFEPLGMKTAGFADEYDVDGAVVSKAYNKEYDFEFFDYPGMAFACGDLMASPEDLYQWYVGLCGGQVVSDESYAMMIKNYSPDSENPENGYGYGLMTAEKGGYTMVTHSGHLDSYYSCIAFCPELGFFEALVSNHSTAGTPTLASNLAKAYYMALSGEKG